jgi:hypothetical protein
MAKEQEYLIEVLVHVPVAHCSECGQATDTQPQYNTSHYQRATNEEELRARYPSPAYRVRLIPYDRRVTD